MKNPNRLNKVQILWLDFITPIQVWLFIRVKRNSWVSKKAEQIIRTAEKRHYGRLVSSIHEWWGDQMYPERGATTFLIALLVILLPQLILASGIYQYLHPITSAWAESETFQSTLTSTWQVLASVIGIAFVIVVFLTQYVVDRQFERRAFPLFASRTWMVFTVMMGLLTLISMGGCVLLFDLKNKFLNPGINNISELLVSMALYNLVLFLVNILLTVRLYIITYKFLSPYYFKQEFRLYLQKLVRRGVYNELRNRIAKKLVQDQCTQYGIDLSHLDNYPNKIPVTLPSLSKTINEIIDVNLGLLDMVAKRKGSISLDNKNNSIIFLGELGRRVSIEQPQIAHVPLNVEYRHITYPLQMAVRFTPLTDLRRLSNLTEELVLNRDLMASALRNGNSYEVEYLLDNYMDALRSFLQAFEILGLQYSFEMAQKEISIFSEWPFASSISEQYFDLLDQAVKSNNLEILRLFTGFPVQVMALAFHEKDHLLFKRFSNLYPAIYVKSLRFLEDQNLKRFVKDRSWRLLVDFDRIQIAHSVENIVTFDKDIGAITDYSIRILHVLNNLLKSSIDLQDWEQYRYFASAMRQVYRSVDTKYDQGYLTILEIQTEQSQEQPVPESLKQRYLQAKAIVREKERVGGTRKALMVGIGAWLLHLFETGRLTAPNLSDYRSSVDMEFLSASEMYELYCVYLDTRKINDLTDWTSWELAERPESVDESGGGALVFDNWLSRYYVIRMLELMPANEHMALPSLKSFFNSASILDMVKNQLSYLEKSPAWQDYLHVTDPAYKYRANALVKLHQAAADEQEVLEEIDIVRQPLDQEKVNAFRDDVQKSWLENSFLRKLFTHHRKFEMHPDREPPNDLQAYGVHELSEKEAYIKQNRIEYPNWGATYGRALGNSEDQLLAAQILGVETKTTMENDLDNAIILRIAEMTSAGYSPIILCERTLLYQLIYKSPHFRGHWALQNSLLDRLSGHGLYEETMVFSINGIPEKTIIMLDFGAFATLVQYRPTEKSDFPLYISIDEISVEKAKSILEKNPAWAINPRTKEALSEEAAIRRIQQNVTIQIWERFRLENVNPKAGKVLQVMDTPKDIPTQETI